MNCLKDRSFLGTYTLAYSVVQLQRVPIFHTQIYEVYWPEAGEASTGN